MAEKYFSKLLLLVSGLSFLGFADSMYLTADHYFKLPLPCSLTNGCDTVLHSAYSMIGPVPTALLGVFYYLAILLLTIHHYTSESAEKKLAWAVFGITGAGVLASAFFLYLQAFVIHAFCQYCLGSAGISTLLFIVSIFVLRGVPKAGESGN